MDAQTSGGTPDAEKQTKPKSPFLITRGVKFPKDGKFITGRLRARLRRNLYEMYESEAVLRVLRRDDVVMELGAGIGYMSALVGIQRKAKSVHAFEANPHLIPYIRSVYEANALENVNITHAILGKRKGSADFYVRKNLLASSLTPFDDDTDVEMTKVDVLNARQVVKDIAPTMLICDIEGAEVDLIPELDLTGLRAAVVETHPQWIGPAGINKVFQAFMDAGLAYYHNGSNRKVISFRRDW